MTTTPPENPTYGVRFSETKVQLIVDRVYPQQKVKLVEQLPTGSSYNNRIYILTFANSAATRCEDETVLKVSGRYFGAEKIENEVSSLFLLEQYCPNIPAPRVLAWSSSGIEGADVHIVKRSDGLAKGSITGIASVAHCANDHGSSQSGWILLCKRPGRRLECLDLEGPAGDKIMKELAQSMLQMRKAIPAADCIGNLKLLVGATRRPHMDINCIFLGSGIQMYIEGLLNCTQSMNSPIISALNYHKVRIQDQLAKLSSDDVYASTRQEVVKVVEAFLTHALPRMQLFKKDSQPTFTHYDLSPSNILVSGSPLSVTGLIDFEFAGFFPPEEEFANNAVCNEGDWPAPAYETLLRELESDGIDTPLNRSQGKCWREVMLLMELIESIAPWWLRGMDPNGEETLQECRKAADSISRCVRELQSMLLDPQDSSLAL